MTENEKIELFDKWYDENYDEWAEGEEGIALREELEQAFKGGIAELEEKISILLSCKNCPENKGGFICQKEYENKCLAQKIEYIKELQEENAELRKVAEFQQSSNMNRHFENKKLKEGLAVGSTFNKALNSMNKNLEEERDKYRNMVFDKDDQLTKAKVFIRSLKSLIEDVCDINYLSKDNTRLLVEAEQFLNEVEK